MRKPRRDGPVLSANAGLVGRCWSGRIIEQSCGLVLALLWLLILFSSGFGFAGHRSEDRPRRAVHRKPPSAEARPTLPRQPHRRSHSSRSRSFEGGGAPRGFNVPRGPMDDDDWYCCRSSISLLHPLLSTRCRPARLTKGVKLDVFDIGADPRQPSSPASEWREI